MKYLFLLLISIPAFCQTLTFNPSSQNDFGVTLNKSVNDSNNTLNMTGFGLGQKKIGLTFVNICVDQFFVEHPENFNRDENNALSSLSNVGAMIMNLTFLRSLDSGLIESSIQDAISENISESDIPKYQSDIDQVKNALLSVSNLSYMSTISFAVYPNQQTIVYYDPFGKVININYSNNDFYLKLLGLWFGPQFDSAGERQKEALLQVPNLGG